MVEMGLMVMEVVLVVEVDPLRVQIMPVQTLLIKMEQRLPQAVAMEEMVETILMEMVLRVRFQAVAAEAFDRGVMTIELVVQALAVKSLLRGRVRMYYPLLREQTTKTHVLDLLLPTLPIHVRARMELHLRDCLQV
jgi:hypothetical protein